jgi:hypothetical protein
MCVTKCSFKIILQGGMIYIKHKCIQPEYDCWCPNRPPLPPMNSTVGPYSRLWHAVSVCKTLNPSVLKKQSIFAAMFG